MEAGADKDASTTDTRLTALHMACRTGNVAILRLLLEKGAGLPRQDALELYWLCTMMVGDVSCGLGFESC